MPLFSHVQGNPAHPTLVFLHGFLGNTDDWSETIHYLKDEYYCIAIDLPGHGKSVAISPPLQEDFECCHRLIKRALDDLSVEKYTFIGYSLGGRIALDYARSQNDAGLQGLVLESCYIGLASDVEKELRYLHDLKWAKCFATEGIIESLTQWYEQSVFNNLNTQEKSSIIDKREHNYGVYLANILLATSLSKQIHALPFLQDNDRKDFPLPVYYCFGEKDLKFKQLAQILSTQTDVKVTQFADAGHNIHQQIPQQFAQFIKQNIIILKKI